MWQPELWLVNYFAGVMGNLFTSTKPTDGRMFWTEAAVLNAYARAALPDAAEDGGGWARRCMTGITPSSFNDVLQGHFNKLSFTL